jgi:hypothetical protein
MIRNRSGSWDEDGCRIQTAADLAAIWHFFGPPTCSGTTAGDPMIRKSGNRFSSGQTRSICLEIMLKQKPRSRSDSNQSDRDLGFDKGCRDQYGPPNL